MEYNTTNSDKLSKGNSQAVGQEYTIPLDKKLSALMLKGWALLADVCPLEKCQCPLTRNSNNKKYCCNCEAWIHDNNKQEPMNFIDLVPPKGKKNAQIMNKEIIETSTKKQEPMQYPSSNSKVIQIIKNKLEYLTEGLATESDSTKTKLILQNINLCIKNIKELNELNS